MPAEFKSVDATTAHRLFDSGAHMVDIRSQREWEAGRVEGADRVAAGRISSHSVGRADTVIVVCANGSRSRKAAKKLAKEGYRVYHLAGGLEAWHAAGLPLTSSNAERPRIL